MNESQICVLILCESSESYKFFWIEGLVKDDTKTLEEIKLTSGAKVMVVGSTIKDIEKVKTPTTQELRAEAKAEGIKNIVGLF